MPINGYIAFASSGAGYHIDGGVKVLLSGAAEGNLRAAGVPQLDSDDATLANYPDSTAVLDAIKALTATPLEPVVSGPATYTITGTITPEASS